MVDELKDNVRKRLVNLFGLGKVGVIDVGSAGGLPLYWKNQPWRIKYLLEFEPRDKFNLTSSRIFHENIVLWNKKSKENFYIYKGFNQTGSSLFRQNINYVRKNFDNLRKIGNKHLATSWFNRSELLEVQRVDCDTLDSVLANYPKNMFNFLKIDAQGAEAQILNGARGFLDADCCGIFLETFRIPLYVGIHLHEDIEKFLLKFGFVLAKKFPPHGTFNSQNDCLFIKKGANLGVVSIIKKVYGV